MEAEELPEVYKIKRVDGPSHKNRWPSLLDSEPGFLIYGPEGEAKTLYPEKIALEIHAAMHIGYDDGLSDGYRAGCLEVGDKTLSLFEVIIKMLEAGRSSEVIDDLSLAVVTLRANDSRRQGGQHGK